MNMYTLVVMTDNLPIDKQISYSLAADVVVKQCLSVGHFQSGPAVFNWLLNTTGVRLGDRTVWVPVRLGVVWLMSGWRPSIYYTPLFILINTASLII